MDYKRADKRKYHYIYKTTCLVTGKWYIGLHSTDDLNDGYIGSGTYLANSIRKHGRENHVCVILEHHLTRDAVKQRETELITWAEVELAECMNLVPGGNGGNVHLPERWVEIQKLGYQAGIASMSFEQKSKRSKTVYQNRLQRDPNAVAACNAKRATAGCQAALAEDVKAKRKETMRERGHAQGRKNPMHGRCWIIKDSKSISIKQEELESYLSQGWARGRKRILSSVAEQSPTRGTTPIIENGRIHL